jgi:hypothetical protein
MSWNRKNSNAEQLMVDVLEQVGKPLTLIEIVEIMLKMNPIILTGKTPKNSLFSILHRREIRRKEMGYQTLFIKTTKGKDTFYRINPKGKNFVGERILKK